ncbi:MAG: type II secretion system F family protein [Desulfobacteraceae bacterium]|nr:type II secretion system F family protein [Desulfobacteraceae bacterium]
MAEYSYQAINKSGNKIIGVIEADSRKVAQDVLTARGHIPIDVAEKKRLSTNLFWQRLQDRMTPVKTSELILFTKQFRTLLRAGVPVMTLFQALETQTENDRLRNIIVNISQEVQEGATLHHAFRRYPNVFSPIYCSMIRAGEASGALVQLLDRLIYLMEHEHKIKSDVRSAMIYPAVVIVFLISAVILLLTFVIPKFVTIFNRSGLDLPLPTLLCIRGSEFLSDYWIIIAIAGMLLLFGFNAYTRTENGRFVRDSMLLRLPIIGQMLLKSAMSRFASIFSILQSSGVTILESLQILKVAINNAAISREFDMLSERLEQGRGISVPLRASKYFTPIVISMIAIGEESGNLEEMLKEISIHYDAEVEYAMKKLSDSIVPILTLGLAVVVGFFALAIYLPMWDFSQLAR